MDRRLSEGASSARVMETARRGWRSAMLPAIIGTGIRVGGNVLLIPLLLLFLSIEEQALWWVFLALGNFAQLADFGLGHAISRVYSFLWAGAEDFDAEGLRAPPERQEPNLERIRALNATVSRLYWLLSVGAVGVLAIGGTWYLWSPVGEFVRPGEAWIWWLLYLVVIGVNLGSSHWMLACQGVDRVREVQAMGVISGLGYLLTVACLLIAGAGLGAMVAGAGVRAGLGWVLMKRVYWRAVASPAAGRTRADFGMLRRLWPNAKKFGILSIGAYLINNGNVLICRQFLGAEWTASFGLTAQLGAFMMNFSGLWLGVKWPRIAILRTQGRLRDMSILFARRLTCVMGTFVVLSWLVWMAGDWLLEWKGSPTRLLPETLLAVYLFYLAQHLFYVQFGLLTFTENVVPFFRIGLFTGIGVFLASWAATQAAGIWGMVVAPLVVESICSNWYTVRRGFRGQSLGLRDWLRHAMYLARRA